MTDLEIQEFELALRQLGPRDQNLAEVVKNHLAAGQTQYDVLTTLTSFREQLFSAGGDEEEDVVLEVMNYVVGWASPYQKLQWAGGRGIADGQPGGHGRRDVATIVSCAGAVGAGERARQCVGQRLPAGVGGGSPER